MDQFDQILPVDDLLALSCLDKGQAQGVPSGFIEKPALQVFVLAIRFISYEDPLNTLW